MHFFFQWLYSPCGPWPLYFSFLIYTRTVGLLERVISSSQGLYLNIRQHKHRKRHIHTIKHPCPQGGIRTRSHGLRAIEGCSCFRSLGYRDRLLICIYHTQIIDKWDSLTHSWSWALLEKPPIVQLLKDFPAFYESRRFITVFTRAFHWSLSW
jgi:hypothetical protein